MKKNQAENSKIIENNEENNENPIEIEENKENPVNSNKINKDEIAKTLLGSLEKYNLSEDAKAYFQSAITKRVFPESNNEGIIKSGKNSSKAKEYQKNEDNDGFFSNLLGYPGYLEYFYDFNTMNAELIPIQSINPVLRIKKKHEIFALYTPSKFYRGKPVFTVVRGFPVSISYEPHPDYRLIEKDYLSSDIDALLNSIYTQMIFRPKRVDITSVTLLLLSVLSSILGTIVLYPWTVTSEVTP